MKWTLAVLSVALLSVSLAHGQGEFALKEIEIAEERASTVFWARGYLYKRPAGMFGGGELPESEAQVMYLQGNLGQHQVSGALEMTEKPKLYLDSDGDNDLADEEPVEGTSEKMENYPGQDPRELDFGVVAVTVKGLEQPMKVRISGRKYREDYAYLRMRPATALTGEVTLGGRKYNIQIMDGNQNGRYDDTFTSARRYDYDALMLDRDGDGEISHEGYFGGGEVIPLPGKLQFGEKWYTISVAEDGSKVKLEPADPGYGKLQWGCEDAELTLISDAGYYKIGPGETEHRLPAGSYGGVAVELRRTDDSGNEWSISSTWQTGELREFTIREGETKSMNAGLPLSGKVTVQPRGRGNVSIGYAINGPAGEEYSAGATKRGRRQPAPKFKILNESDEVVHTDKFEYG